MINNYSLHLKSVLLFFLVVFVTPTTRAQQKQVNELNSQFEREQAARTARVAAYITRTGLEKRIYNDSLQTTSELIDVELGVPYYYITHNREGGTVIKADRVYPNGGANLNLTGTGQTLGIWDGGGVRTTHLEFTSRVTQRDVPAGLSDHATHVGGTMMAAGISNLSGGGISYPQGAKGISYAANLYAYDWNNDGSEMVTAASAGLQVSQHSYGFTTGWAYGSFSGTADWHWFGAPSISETEDFRFGYYDNSSRSWDLIANAADEYLIVKSAGNDRGQGPAPGTTHYFQNPANNFNWTVDTATRDVDGGTNGYDCITDAGNAKNVLTVGAVTAAGDMSSFSGWGPTDDGRVKPDLVAKGVNVLSTGSSADNTYYFSNGTSMSGPMISGAMGLLMEHQHNLNPGKKMKAATLKGLAIHTANDRVGGSAEGPDYRFGWGLMDVEKAALTMEAQANTGIHIFEAQLAQGEAWYIQIEATGTAPLRATVIWNDPAAAVSSASLNNRTPKLVNDLDIRLIHTNGTFEPYTLDPNNPATPATKGDNFRDNVEMVHIENPTSGNYIVKITHKGTLTNSQQPFSLIITGNEEVTTVADLSLIPASAKVVIIGTTTINGDLEISGLSIPTTGEFILGPNSNLIVNNDFEVESGGKLLLKSDATGYAQMKIHSGASVNVLGEMNQEQWVNGSGWRNIGLSLIGQQAQDLGTVVSTSAGRNFTKWDAATSEWVPVLPNETLTRGVGYAAFVGDFGVVANNEKFIASGTPTVAFSPALDFHDEVGSSSVFVNPAATDGWNFISNPFTAGLDFSAIPIGNFTHTNRAFYIWNPSKGATGGYDVWSAGASPNDISPIIPPMQGFWVRTTALGASLGTLTSDYATLATPTTFLKTNEVQDHIIIELHNQQKKIDQLTLALVPFSKLGFDEEWDAIKKLHNTSEASIYSVGGRYPLAINAIPFDASIQAPYLVPIGIGDTYLPLSLKLNTAYLNFNASIYLWNKTDGNLTKLGSNALSLPVGSAKKELFLVLSNQGSINKTLIAPMHITQSNQAVYVSSNGYSGVADVSLMGLNGRDVFLKSFYFDIDHANTLNINTTQFAKGVYLLHLKLDNGEVLVKKIIL